jgi:hypothetical protein
MNLLRFRYEPDDEWCGKLIATCEANGFAGRGEAWFAPDHLRAFAKATSNYPLRRDEPPSLQGGFRNLEGALTRVHVGIVFEPHDVRGLIRATVRLATEVWHTEEKDLESHSVVRFLLTYADLAPFGSDFADLIEEKVVEAVLRSSI